tara:strand:+ start:68 stop:502 length:435 start_codon:yes stop_codon:yes gene_type:complete
MATTTFSGPIKAGSIREGSSANTGFVVMAQSAAITQSTTAATSGIKIPANSQILEATVFVTTAFDNSATLSIGTSSSSNELATAVAVSTVNTIKLASQATITDADNWKDVGSSDVDIYVDSSATTADAGRAILTVTYIQNNNLA